MAKLAVIFFLFALCAVAMSARIAREEPTKKPLDQLGETFKSFVDQAQQLLQNPELQKAFQGFGETVKEAGKKLGDSIHEQASKDKH